MARILLITRYFPPLDSIACQRMYAWAKYLQRMGHEIDVLTTDKTGQVVCPLDWDCSAFQVHELPYFDPFLSAGLKKDLLVNGRPSRAKEAALRFYRTRFNERMPGRTDPWIITGKRWLKEQRAQGRRYDAAISSYGPPAAHCLGATAKRLFQCRWIADYRDLWIENASFAGLWPFTFLERLLERRWVGQADGITTISDPYRDFLQKKFPRIPVHTIENGFDPERWLNVGDDAFCGNKRRLVYTGALYPKTRDPGPLLAALAAGRDKGWLKSEDFELRFYGAAMEGLQDLVDECGLSSLVQVCSAVSYSEAQRIQRSADALLLVESSRHKVDGVLTGKLFDYLAAAKPVLAVGVNAENAAGKLIQATGCGVACGEDTQQISSFLKKLVNGQLSYSADTQKIAWFSRQKQTERLAEILLVS